MRRCVIVLALLLASGAHAELTRPPRLEKFVTAEYPAARKAAGETSTVVLTIDVAATGLVNRVTVSESGGADFDAAALAAARQFVFVPGELDGKPGPVRLTYRYRFTLTQEPAVVAPPELAGVVLDRWTKKPRPGITVRVGDHSALTDENGSFELGELPAGEQTVELAGDSLVPLRTVENLQPGTRRTVTYHVEEARPGYDEEEVVRAPRLRQESAVTTLRSSEARRLPGTQGDTLKVVQNLPGVARASAGQVIVWGAAPRDTRVLVDGVEIPALYHIGGLRSTMNSNLVARVELIPGAFGVEYGRSIGGLVRVESRELPQGFHGHVAVDFLDASAMLTVALGKRLRIAVAGRYSYLDQILKPVTTQDPNDLFPVPRYADYQVKASLALRKDEQVSLLFLGSHDRLQRTLASSDPTTRRQESLDSAFWRLALRYTRLMPDGASGFVTPYFGYEQSARRLAFGATLASLENSAMTYGLRAGYRQRLHPRVTLSVGVDLLGARNTVGRDGSLTLPPREGDLYVFGTPPGVDVASDSWSTHTVDFAPHLAVEVAAGRLTLVAGLRADAFLLESSRTLPRDGHAPPVGNTRLQWDLDPRLSLSFRAHSRVTLDVSAGLYHQAPDPEDLSAVFGTPTLGLLRGVHVTGGIKVKLTGTLQLEALGFYKYLDGLVSRAPQPTPPLAQVLTQDGVGRIYGGQLLLRQEIWRNLFGWITYTGSRSEKRDHETGHYRLLDYDQTHVLGVVASYMYKGWGFGVRFRYTSGFPRSPVTQAYYDATLDRYQPLFGRQNSTHLADFIQLDLRFDKRFVFRHGIALDISLDIQNVTYQRNEEEIVYSRDFTVKGAITGLPTLAIFGAKVEW